MGSNNPPAPGSAADQALLQLQQFYFYLNDNFASMIARCTTDAQRDQFKSEFVIARDAYWKAQNDILIENDTVLSSLTGQLSGLQNQIDQAVKGAAAIANILGFVAAATGIAAKIATTATAGI
jgi:hypothetical protein